MREDEGMIALRAVREILWVVGVATFLVGVVTWEGHGLIPTLLPKGET